MPYSLNIKTNDQDSRILFFSLIAIHIAAAVIPIRWWPLTDYPMFSRARGPFTEISRLAVETVYMDRIEPWPKSFYGTVTSTDRRLQLYINDVFHPRVREILSARVVQRHELQSARSLQIVRKTYMLKDSKLSIERKVVREIPIEQLKR